MTMGDAPQERRAQHPRARHLRGRRADRREAEDRKRQVLRQIDAVRKAWAAAEKCKEKLDGTMKGATSKDKRKYRKVRGERMRAHIALSQLIRKIEFTETIKRRMIDQIKDKVEAVMRFQRQIAYIERQLTMKTAGPN